MNILRGGKTVTARCNDGTEDVLVRELPIRQLPEWLASLDVQKQHGGAWVARATLLGRDVAVKCRGVTELWPRIKCMLGQGKADRHWRGAAILASKRIATARVFVLARARIEGRVCELLVMEWLQGPTLLRVMADVHAHSGNAPSFREQHAIARAVGRGIAAMEGLFNRDHKPSNLIVQGAGTSSPLVAVIDCEGVRRTSLPSSARMFSSLVIEPLGCGVLPRRSLMMSALRGWLMETRLQIERVGKRAEPLPWEWHRELRTMMWGSVGRYVAHHGDPKPKVNPLA